jgi:hypothetical protein
LRDLVAEVMQMIQEFALFEKGTKGLVKILEPQYTF